MAAFTSWKDPFEETSLASKVPFLAFVPSSAPFQASSPSLVAFQAFIPSYQAFVPYLAFDASFALELEAFMAAFLVTFTTS